MITLATRSQDGVCEQHATIEKALESFLSPEGYRLDFLYPNGASLYIYRGEYNEGDHIQGLLHPVFSNVLAAEGKIMYYDPDNKIQNTNISHQYENVIPVDFINKGKH